MQIKKLKEEIAVNGFAVANDIFSIPQVKAIIAELTITDTSDPAFRKTGDLFAIRRVMQMVPGLEKLVFNKKLRQLIRNVFGNDFFVVKSIYFDKPGLSNWFVAYHQDLTISVDTKADINGYSLWTVKDGQYAVQPPLRILQDNFTIRIHLDDTDENNGALKVIPGSHSKGIYRPETIDWSTEEEAICNVACGGIMFMKPLLLHSSGRTRNDSQRRVVHIEFSQAQLPEEIGWVEFYDYKRSSS